MIKAHKIRLHPTPSQAVYFARAAGTARLVWNWALAEWNRQYEAGGKPTALKLKKQFNQIRREQFPWTWEVTKNASDQPFLDLGKAFTAFFAGRACRPKFKSKKRSKPSFYLANDQFELGDHRIWIPKLGWVNMAENLRFAGKVTGARITKTADWWFVSLQVEMPDVLPVKKPAAVGIDVGLNRLATLSTGEGVENQAFLKTALGKLRQANKRLHRRNLGSKNREKARRQVARLHYRITCLRDDVLHKLTTQLAACYGIIGIEDLNLKGLLKNRKLARSFSDASLGKLLNLLNTKMEQRGGQVIKVDRFFPSSKTCHCCRWKWEQMQLSERVFLKLTLPTGGGGRHGAKKYPNIVARLTEMPPTGFKEVAISRDARGNYYASFPAERSVEQCNTAGTVAFDLGVKMLATGVNEQGKVYHVGGFKGGRWYNRQLDKIRSKRDKCKKKSRRHIHLSKVYKRVSEKKRNKQRDSLHKASHLISHKLVERTVVVGDLSQRQMVMKEHRERNKHLNRAVFNDWGLFTFIEMLKYKTVLYGKELVFLDERNTSKQCSGCGNLQAMPLWKRTYCCAACGLVMDRDENSAVNILTRYFARLGPHAQPERGVLHTTSLDVAGMEPAQDGQVQQLELW